ncbi:uncharacterized protein ARMOST_08644 [Armillaria ostoyae]|uniref:Uncharacterized protein n=1 Tax=Armillaria ostoyae TaxID=47428 RepID=A0A284R970_ARMOS|nr:uncharacterized protein ARMOST_08644 [Armillaria ostoyae]
MSDEMMGKTTSKQFKKDGVKCCKEMKHHCQCYLEIEEKEKDGEMMYRSRDCQVADWKQQKIGCGKSLDISAAFDDVHIGDSESNTKKSGRAHRSPRVVRLIEYLENTTKHDYLVETTPGKSDDVFSIKFDEVLGAVALINVRNILFTSSSPSVEGAADVCSRWL